MKEMQETMSKDKGKLELCRKENLKSTPGILNPTRVAYPRVEEINPRNEAAANHKILKRFKHSH